MTGHRRHAAEFHGQIVHEASCGGLRLCESTYAPRLRLPLHAHQHAFLTLTIDGGYEEHVGRHTREAGVLHLAYHPPAEEHDLRFAAHPTRCLNIELGPSLLERVRGGNRALRAPADFSGRAIGLALCVARELRRRDPFTAIGAEALALELLGCGDREIARSPRAGNPRIASAIEWLHRTQAQALSLAEIAAELELHPVYLARAFRAATGCSVGTYLRRLRIERAAIRLAGSRDSLAAIASDCGFSDQSHLTRHFKRAMGFTPGEFRAAAAGLRGSNRSRQPGRDPV